jgi:RND family efflux transporter MFP subunit
MADLSLFKRFGVDQLKFDREAYDRVRGRMSRIHFIGLGALGIAFLAVVAFWAFQLIDMAEARSAKAKEASLGPHVRTIDAFQGPTDRTIQLLADVKPHQTATIYAKVSGYLKSIDVDRGDKVKAGQIIAVVDSGETDKQYQAAVADLENKKRLAARSRELQSTGNTSQQAAEQAQTNERMAQAVMGQLDALRSYQTIRAPFDGVITARFADPGALIQSAATSQTNALPIASIADSSDLRVAVYISQVDVPYIHVGDAVEVADATDPTRKVTAKISRTSEMLDPTTRTLLAEIDVDNEQGFLYPGSFAYVTLKAPIKSFVRIPATALIVRNNAQMVAVLGDNDTVKLRPVEVASVDGTVVDIADGLNVGEKVAISIPDDVTDGSHVQPVVDQARGS